MSETVADMTLVSVVQRGPVRRIALARPDKRNALSRALVAELRQIFAAGAVAGTRVVVLEGHGPVFCAGGDIAEFATAAETGHARADADGLADLLAAIAAFPMPVVARVHGAAYGGAIGLLCAADIVVAAEDTRFSLSEARVGLVPAVIAPYVVAALGPREAQARMLLAAPFDAREALRIGLVHRVVPAGDLDQAVDDMVTALVSGAPGAQAAIKQLVSRLRQVDDSTARQMTVELLVERLSSDEGREGLRAFLEKRALSWAPPEGPSS